MGFAKTIFSFILLFLSWNVLAVLEIMQEYQRENPTKCLEVRGYKSPDGKTFAILSKWQNAESVIQFFNSETHKNLIKQIKSDTKSGTKNELQFQRLGEPIFSMREIENGIIVVNKFDVENNIFYFEAKIEESPQHFDKIYQQLLM